MWNLQFTSRVYNEAMLPVYDFDSDEFDRAVAAAGRAAFHETLAAGYPVFYVGCRRPGSQGIAGRKKIRNPLYTRRPIGE
jgi:hypothetical protein